VCGCKCLLMLRLNRMMMAQHDYSLQATPKDLAASGISHSRCGSIPLHIPYVPNVRSPHRNRPTTVFTVIFQPGNVVVFQGLPPRCHRILSGAHVHFANLLNGFAQPGETRARGSTCCRMKAWRLGFMWWGPLNMAPFGQPSRISRL
jgi:hypothetical protein